MPSSEPEAKRARRSDWAEAARTSQACTSCRERKIKCSGLYPCRYCAKKGLQCKFPDNVRKKMYSVAYVEDLERRLSTTGGRAIGTSVTDSFEFTQKSPTPIPQQRLAGSERSAETSPIMMESTLSSSLNFGSRIRSLPNHHHVGASSSGNLSNESPENAYNLDARGLKPPFTRENLEWPSEEEAHDLLNTVLTSIGRLQHLIDPRTFSDRLSAFYDSNDRTEFTSELWYIEILMVFSLGGLLQGRLKETSRFPGAEYFLEAVDRLPSLCALRDAGVLAVEIMGLFAFFLQCSDRKEDAYVYAGVALRLALSNGLARESESQRMKRSEKTHRNRLWWTIYMQERRLAAATGNPVGIPDESVTTSLPTESPGFCSTAALNVNIKLARLTGRIIQSIYGREQKSERQFFGNAQELLSELATIRKSMPPEYYIDFSKSISVTRTGATLHLMLFQAITLITRPILLHMAKYKLEGRDINPLLSEDSPLQKLAVTCVEAAGRCLDVLRSLKQNGLLAKFGFFDLDASVSTAFIFTLAENIYIEKRPGSGIQGIRGAMEVLRYLARSGNRPAEQRLKDVESMCEHLNISLTQSIEQTTTSNREGSGATIAPLESPFVESPSTNVAPTGTIHGVTEASIDSNADLDWRQGLCFPYESFTSLDGMYMEGENFLSGTDFDNFNLDFGTDFALTGADETDWGAFERQVALHQ